MRATARPRCERPPLSDVGRSGRSSGRDQQCGGGEGAGVDHWGLRGRRDDGSTLTSLNASPEGSTPMWESTSCTPCTATHQRVGQRLRDRLDRELGRGVTGRIDVSVVDHQRERESIGVDGGELGDVVGDSTLLQRDAAGRSIRARYCSTTDVTRPSKQTATASQVRARMSSTTTSTARAASITVAVPGHLPGSWWSRRTSSRSSGSPPNSLAGRPASRRRSVASSTSARRSREHVEDVVQVSGVAAEDRDLPRGGGQVSCSGHVPQVMPVRRWPVTGVDRRSAVTGSP